MKSNNNQYKVQKRRWRTRKKVVGSAERPRMSVRFTGKNIYVQFIDDANGHTVASISSMHKSVEDRAPRKQVLKRSFLTEAVPNTMEKSKH